jgi:hypothetical protein
MKTASREMRSIAIKTCQGGIPRRQIAGIAGYHLRSVSRWICEFEREERLEARSRGHWETVTILSSIRLDGATECIVFEGAVDRTMFTAYIKEILSPSPRPGDINDAQGWFASCRKGIYFRHRYKKTIS